MNAKTLSRPFPVGTALIAGLLGGVVLDAKLILINHAPVPQLWQSIASQAVGQIAFSSDSYALLGLLLHFVLSMFWACAYVLLWSKVGSLRNWIVGGIVWGAVVMICMTTLLHFKSGAPWPGWERATFDSLFGHTVFFGLPVAWYVARSLRASA